MGEVSSFEDRAASKNGRSRRPKRWEPPGQARGGVGDGAPATPPFWLCAPTKVGASGGWNLRRGRQRRSRRPLPGRVECPPCGRRYSPGAPQSSGSPACSALSRLIAARVGEVSPAALQSLAQDPTHHALLGRLEER